MLTGNSWWWIVIKESVVFFLLLSKHSWYLLLGVLGTPVQSCGNGWTVGRTRNELLPVSKFEAALVLPGVSPPVTYLGSLAHFLVASRRANVVPKKVLLVQLRLRITAHFEPSIFTGFRGAQMVRNGSDFDLLAAVLKTWAAQKSHQGLQQSFVYPCPTIVIGNLLMATCHALGLHPSASD